MPGNTSAKYLKRQGSNPTNNDFATTKRKTKTTNNTKHMKQKKVEVNESVMLTKNDLSIMSEPVGIGADMQPSDPARGGSALRTQHPCRNYDRSGDHWVIGGNRRSQFCPGKGIGSIQFHSEQSSHDRKCETAMGD